MTFNRFISINLGVIYTLFSLGLSGEDIGLPPILTMRTIALILLLLTFFLVFLYEKDFKLRTNRYLNFSLIILFLICMWILLSYFFSCYQELVMINDILAWFTIPICMLITYKIVKHIKFNDFLTTIVYAQFTALTLLYVWSILNVGNLTNFLEIRLFINWNLEIGLNRLLNGVMFLNIISIAIVLGIYKTSKILFITSFINVVLSFYLAFISGSRQSIIAFLITIFLLIVINRYIKGIKGFNFKGIMFTLVFILILISLFQNEQVYVWIEERFIDKTQEQLTTGDIRTSIYQNAIQDVKDNLLFGTGPGTYHQVSTLGMHTHNGYLYMMNNFGIVPFIMIFFLFLFFIYKSTNEKNTVNKNNKQSIYVIFFTSLLVFLIMNLFRDLITMLSFWMSIVLLITCFDSREKLNFS